MLFKDQHCSEYARRESAWSSGPAADSPTGMNACMSMGTMIGPWGSVIFNHTSA